MADPALLPKIAMVESGDRNIPGPMTDSGQAQGNYQITEGTWRDFAPKLGVDLGLYPDAMSAPKWLQTQVAQTIPLKRWDPRTLDALGITNPYGLTAPHISMDQFAPYFSRMEANQAASERATAPYREKIEKQLGEDMDRAHRAADAIEPVDIQKWSLPPPQNNPVDGFASIGAIFAGIASAFTHTPAINAMNGMAAAIQARNEGNQTAYKQAYEAWKDNTQLAIDRQKVQSAAFTRALDLMQTNVVAGSAALKSAASVYGDRNTLAALEEGAFEKIAVANATADRTAMLLGVRMKQVDAGGPPGSPGYITNQIFNQIKQDHPEMSDGDAWQEAEKLQKSTSPATERGRYDKPVMANVDDGKGGTAIQMVVYDKDAGGYVTAEGRQPVSGVKSIAKDPNDINDPNDPTVKTTAQAIADYQLAPLSGFVLKSKFGQMVMADVIKQNPAYDAKKYNAMQFAERQFFGGQEGRQTRSMNVAIAHLDTFQELADALQNGEVQRINAIAQRVAAETGQSAPTNFDTAKQIIGQEITKAIVAGGGGVTERQEMSEHLSRASSPEQLKGVITTAQRLLAGQLGGLQRQYEKTTGNTDYGEFLSPRAKQLLTVGAEASQQARPDGTTPAKTGGNYSSADDVKKAYHDGKITKDDATKILRDKFGYE